MVIVIRSSFASAGAASASFCAGGDSLTSSGTGRLLLGLGSSSSASPSTSSSAGLTSSAVTTPSLTVWNCLSPSPAAEGAQQPDGEEPPCV
eukprot:CAMPEP_0178432204 /NCGR_PEP_ID=MMETSP0689_2-20121128/32261_1 /TAXON_ID=160604 /ORGANISM="Amphidinium massartii, Strain CS-259" /LENGTH=90 /DNA_ID=CAMNT_0020054177 /DNA_START=375 /DNA_END=647 /DNA_ORIENTATION=+